MYVMHGTDFDEHVISDHSVEVLSVCGRCYDESKVGCIYSIISNGDSHFVNNDLITGVILQASSWCFTCSTGMPLHFSAYDGLCMTV